MLKAWLVLSSCKREFKDILFMTLYISVIICLATAVVYETHVDKYTAST